MRLMLSVELMDNQILLKTKEEMARSPLRGFHAEINRICCQNFLIAQAVFDESIYAHGRPPRVLPLQVVMGLNRDTHTAKTFDLIKTSTPPMAEALHDGIEAYLSTCAEKIEAATGTRTEFSDIKQTVDRMEALLLVSRDWGVTDAHWNGRIEEARSELRMAKTRLATLPMRLNPNAPSFVPSARKRPYSTRQHRSPVAPKMDFAHPSRAMRRKLITPDTPYVEPDTWP